METEDYSNLFTVTPMGQNIELVPGETYEGSIIVANPATATNDFSYKVSVNPYNVRGEEYTVNFADETNQSQITKWISFHEPAGTLKPNESRRVNFTITVPEDAAGGGQYATIMVSSADNNTGDGDVQVNNIFEIASIIYARVDGEINRDGRILENKLPGFIFDLPAESLVKVDNHGNIHELAKVTLVVHDFFTGNVVYPTEGSDGVVEEVIMPDTTRAIIREIDGIPPLGIFNMEQTVNYMGQESVTKQTIIVCPIWFIIIVVITIATITGAIIGIVKHHKRKKVVV